MSSPEVLVIGAGPGGCVAAIEHARRGHRVWLCEAKPEAAERRLGGEWLHNTGNWLLRELGVDVSGAHPGEGFVVHPGDASESIVLPYVQAEGPGALARMLLGDRRLDSEAHGFSWEHADLVERLRERALAQPGVEYRSSCRVRLEREEKGDLRVALQENGRPERVVNPERVVDATGKSGLGRKALGLADRVEPVAVSRMCGLELEQVDVPLARYGHVFLGGPGPMLMYRIRERSIRIIVDIPRWYDEGRKPSHDALQAHWGDTLPHALRTAFARALRESKPKWVNIRVRVRDHYGHDRLALIGDAVGHYHPLTATGMTNAILDASALARHQSVRAYGQERTRTSKSAGLLGVALYDMFSRPEPESARMRAALFEWWRTDAKERHRTMGYLGMGDQRVTAFVSSYLKVVSGGVSGAEAGERMRAIRQSAAFLQKRAPWLLGSFGAKTAIGAVMVRKHAERAA